MSRLSIWYRTFSHCQSCLTPWGIESLIDFNEYSKGRTATCNTKQLQKKGRRGVYLPPNSIPCLPQLLSLTPRSVRTTPMRTTSCQNMCRISPRGFPTGSRSTRSSAYHMCMMYLLWGTASWRSKHQQKQFPSSQLKTTPSSWHHSSARNPTCRTHRLSSLHSVTCSRSMSTLPAHPARGHIPRPLFLALAPTLAPALPHFSFCSIPGLSPFPCPCPCHLPAPEFPFHNRFINEIRFEEDPHTSFGLFYPYLSRVLSV